MPEENKIEEKKEDIEARDEKLIDDRKEKIKNWLKNPSNIFLLLILIFALSIRLYYLFPTLSQPLWWDEAEYGLKAKSLAFGTPTTGWFGAREIVVPLLFSLILRIGGTEVSWRLVQLLVSFMTIILVYLLAKNMFNRRIALMASAIMAVNAVHLFFTFRILTYLWAPLFFLLTFYTFYMGYIKRKGKKYLYSFPIIAALGLSIYGSLAFGIVAIFIFLIITERYHFLKRKETWFLVLIGLITLIPQFIYSKIAYGSAIARWTALQSSKPLSNFSFLFSYFKLFPHLFGWIFTIVILIGVIYIITILIASFDLILKNQHDVLKSYLLIILWALGVLGFYTYVAIGWGTVYDAFVISSFPALAMIGAVGINLSHNLKLNEKFLTFILIIIIIFGAYYQISYANNMIKNKLTSFDSVKYAGQWINKNSNSRDIVVSSSLPQMTYYSERETYPYTDINTNRTTEEQFDEFLKEKKPKFITDSVWEYVPAWVHSYAQKHNSTMLPVQAYFLDAQKTQPSLIIYEVRY